MSDYPSDRQPLTATQAKMPTHSMTRGEEARSMTESILMKYAPANGKTLKDSMWAPKDVHLRKVPKKHDLPACLQELNNEPGKTKGRTSPVAKPTSWIPPHMRGLKTNEKPIWNPPPHMKGLDVDDGMCSNPDSRVSSEASTQSGSVLQMPLHSKKTTINIVAGKDSSSQDKVGIGESIPKSAQQPSVLNTASSLVDVNHGPAEENRWVEKSITNMECRFQTSDCNRDQDTSVISPTGQLAITKSTSGEATAVAPSTTKRCLSASPATAKQSIASETIEKGTLFARNAANKYGTPKYLKLKQTSKDKEITQSSPVKEAEKEVEPSTAGIIKPCSDSSVSTVRGSKHTSTCSKLPEETATVPALSSPMLILNKLLEPSAPAPAAGVPQPSVDMGAKHLNMEASREHAVYFSSWGPQLHRDTPAAQKRKVIITGDPVWESTPKPDFITSLVFGGPLEQILCSGNAAAVTFINSADAEKYYNSTPNGVVYRSTSETLQYVAEIMMADDVTPVSSLVQEYVNHGFTRCVRAIGVDVAMSLEELTAIAGGKPNSRGSVPRKLERLEDDMSCRGYRVVTFRFCDIREAVVFRAEIARNPDWEHVNVQFHPDPCAVAVGPRVEIRPITKVF